MRSTQSLERHEIPPAAQLSSASPKVWTDAYLAAFAIGHDQELVTIDSDFKNFEKAGLNLKMLTL